MRCKLLLRHKATAVQELPTAKHIETENAQRLPTSAFDRHKVKDDIAKSTEEIREYLPGELTPKSNRCRFDILIVFPGPQCNRYSANMLCERCPYPPHLENRLFETNFDGRFFGRRSPSLTIPTSNHIEPKNTIKCANMALKFRITKLK